MLTTFQAAARLNRRAMERNEPRRYTASHVAALCAAGIGRVDLDDTAQLEAKLREALADGTVSSDEFAELRREMFEVVAALLTLLSRLEGMVRD
jgi:hypothetical protein